MTSSKLKVMAKRGATLKRQERLRGLKNIEGLFAQGKVITTPKFRCYYLAQTSSVISQAMFVVKKKEFRKAVVRHKIRRRMKEAYRQEKALTRHNGAGLSYHLALIYQGQDGKVPSYAAIVSEMRHIFERLYKNLKSPDNTL